jgi:hypothetical protein
MTNSEQLVKAGFGFNSVRSSKIKYEPFYSHVKQINIHRPIRILSLGSGLASYEIDLMEQLNADHRNAHILCVDQDEKMYKLGQKNLPINSKYLNVDILDAKFRKYLDGQIFDILLLQNILHFLSNDAYYDILHYARTNINSLIYLNTATIWNLKNIPPAEKPIHEDRHIVTRAVLPDETIQDNTPMSFVIPPDYEWIAKHTGSKIVLKKHKNTPSFNNF